MMMMTMMMMTMMTTMMTMMMMMMMTMMTTITTIAEGSIAILKDVSILRKKNKPKLICMGKKMHLLLTTMH